MPKYHYQRLVRMRLSWILLYEQGRNVSYVHRHFGISRKTFYKWYKRYQSCGRDCASLLDMSRRPKHSPRRTDDHTTGIIKKLRKKTKFGADRINFYLKKDYCLEVPRSTIYAILKREGMIAKPRKHKKKPKLYTLPNPGDNVQVDIKLIGGYSPRRLVQYSAIDDNTRIKFTQLYPERANHNSIKFLEYIVHRFPFSIRKITTDNDSVFTNAYTGEPKTHPLKEVRLHPFTLKCQEFGTDHKLNPPGQPQKNGKVERSHRSDDEEFWRFQETLDIQRLVKERRQYDELFNNHRPHMGLEGLTPLQKLQSHDIYRSVTYVYS